MQLPTTTTPTITDVTTANVSANSTSNSNQQPSQSSEQEKSFVRTLFPKSKWCDTMELFGRICLFIIIHVVNCELARFCIEYLCSLSNDAFLFRYQCVFLSIIFLLSFLAIIGITVGASFVLAIAIEFIFLRCVKYYHVEKKSSYEWWEKKLNIPWIFISIISLIYIIINIELGSLCICLFQKDLPVNRYFLYYSSGFCCTLFSSIILLLAFSEKKAVYDFVKQDLL